MPLQFDLSPAQMKAWLCLIAMSETTQPTPVTTLAEHLKVSHQAATKHVSALVNAGLAERGGVKGTLKVLKPGSRTTVHEHPPGHACTCQPGASLTLTMQPFRPPTDRETVASRSTTPGNHSKNHATFSPYKNPSGSSIVANRLHASKLHKLADVYTKKNRRKKVSSPDVKAFARAYSKERLLYDRDFDLRVSHDKHFAVAVGRLRDSGLGPQIYRRYVTHCFETFRRVNKEGLPFCPIPVMKSESFIESFRASLGNLKLNAEKAKSILADEGITGVDYGIVITIAARIHSQERSMPKGLDALTEKAIACLVGRFKEIGYDLSDFGGDA